MSETTKQTVETKTFTVNGVSFDMMLVEAGMFIMGVRTEVRSYYNNQCPEHIVMLTNNYYMGKTQVTQALWKAVMGNNPSKFEGDNRPVECVSWDDCQEFIEKLNSATCMNFRLPTEAEWEFAARGGNNSKFFYFCGSQKADDVAWFDENSQEMTQDVATKQPNELGLFDMSGNVNEWCTDWFGEYTKSTKTDPTGPADGENRVMRGCAYNCGRTTCIPSYRGKGTPDYKSESVGLRLVLSEDKY